MTSIENPETTGGAPNTRRGARRVLINALHARSGGGVTYLKNMLPMIADDPDFEVHICAHEDQRELLPSGIKGVHYHFFSFERGFWKVLVREQIEVPRLARRIKADVTFSPANYGPIFAPNAVVMLRNAVSVGLVEKRPIKLAYWALLFAATLLSLVTSKRAIAVSDYASRVGAGFLWKWTRSKINIVPHGVGEKFRPNPSVVRDQTTILAVSDIYVQKNFKKLLIAFAGLVGENPDLQLKIAGRPLDMDYYGQLKTLITDLSLEHHVSFLGSVELDELIVLYQSCCVFVFPSTVETFGNPLVEAMACGTPIACSNAAAMPEVLGQAGLYFDPENPDDIRDKLREFINNPNLRSAYSADAEARSREFSWIKTMGKTKAVLVQ